MRIIIAAGGTGGHIYPGIAIAEEIKSRDPKSEILFIGSEEGLEKNLVPRAGFNIKLIKSRALLRKVSYKALSAPFVSMLGFFQSLLILREFKPQVLLSTGGYASLPVVLAAKICSVPIFLQEQNVLPGITTRICNCWAKQIFLSFDESLKYIKGKVAGNPVRKEILAADREKSRRAFGFLPNERVVLIMGGSQGARKINEAVVAALPLLEKANNIKIYHLVGQRDMPLVSDKLAGRKYACYQNAAYLYNMADILAAADLVVSRAGATAIAEFVARGIPMILVPFPYSAEGHQDLNAEVMADKGTAVKVDNNDFTPEKFKAIVSMDLSKMKKITQPNAAKEIVNAIIG